MMQSIRQCRLTLGVVLQGLWGLLLSRLASESDVVFGTTVSGRPSDLAGADRIVGPFINTIPVRINVNNDSPLEQWLQEHMQRQVNGQPFHSAPLASIQRLCQVPAGWDLFQSLLVIENYPADSGGQSHCPHLSACRFVERTNYPLTLTCGGDHEFHASLAYDTQWFDENIAEGLLRAFLSFLLSFSEAPAQRVGALQISSRMALQRTADHVAIRGLLVGKEQLSAALLEHDTVEQVAVHHIAAKDESSKGCVVLAVAPTSASAHESELKSLLYNRFLVPAVPEQFRFVTDVNGPEAAAVSPRTAPSGSAATNDLEQTIAEVWSDVLQIDDVRTDQNFFDLGADSMRILHVAERLSRKLPDEELSVIDLFSYPTVAMLANHLVCRGGNRATERLRSRTAERMHAMRQHRRRQRGNR